MVALINKLFRALSRTRESVSDAFDTLLKRKITPESLEELEDILIGADMGFQTVDAILKVVQKHRQEDFLKHVEDYLISILARDEYTLSVNRKPSVLMVVGVNGTGKTTSAAKLAHFYKSMGKKVLLVAADTHRAAAVEQLKIWSKRLEVDIVYNEKSQQPTAVLFDGLAAAQAQGAGLVIVDTAGRLHTNKNLMAELAKMFRMAENRFPDFELHSLITLDAGLGQNSLNQAREFAKAIRVDGVVLTKMDGTAKGGIVFPLLIDLNIPVHFVGIGEDYDDLYPFQSRDYVQGLLGTG